MGKLPFLVLGKVLLLLTLVPLPSNAFASMALITTGKDVLMKAVTIYQALEDFHQQVVQTGVEKLTPAQGATLRKLDSIYWDLSELKNDVKNWQAKEEMKEIANKIDQLMNKVNKVDFKYKDYERFRFNNSFIVNNVVVKAEPDMIQGFSKAAISHNNDELPEILEDMHKAFTGVGALRDSVLNSLATNTKADLMCVRKQSAQQFILELFRTVIDADIKGLVVKLFAYDELAKYKQDAHAYDYSKITSQEKLEARIERTRAEVKRLLAYASREVWRCDPQEHIKDVTYAKMQEIFQTYAYHEKDYRNNMCQQSCRDYSYRPFTPECKTSFCLKHTERKRCHGKLKNCQKIHKTQTYCFAPESSDRRYEWMLTGSNTSYGAFDVGCEDTIKADETQGVFHNPFAYGMATYSDCDTCICTCVSEKKDIDRYFSLNPVYADVDKNMVVTGISFVKKGHVISLQIQQGRLTPNGSIDQSTLEWKNETDSPNYGVYKVDEEHNTVFLDDILSPSEGNRKLNEEFVVSGVRFEVMDNSLRLKVSFVPYDYTTGTVYNYEQSSRAFKGNDKRKDKRGRLQLVQSADPTKTNTNLLDSTHQQRIEFQLSDLERDFGQSTVPYIDIQRVESIPAIPLVGIGLMHKGTKGSGGFLGLKLIQYNYTPYI